MPILGRSGDARRSSLPERFVWQKSAIRFREKSGYSDKSFCLDGNFHFRAKISRSKRVTAQERKKEEKAAKVAK